LVPAAVMQPRPGGPDMGRKRRQARALAGARELHERIEHWRRMRTKLGPMPAELWDEAVALAAKHGVYTITRTVGVEYNALKRRVEALAGGGAADEGTVKPAFVELRAAVPDAAAAKGETVVEVSDRSGRRMTIRMGSGAAVDVAQVVSAFWGLGA